MLVFALAVFTLVAVMGLGLICDVFKGSSSSKTYAVLHAGFALIGSALVILDALGGDNRVWINIGLAVVIIVLGGLVSLRRHKGQNVKALALAHGGLAVVCYLILAAFAFNLA
jgi:hypothetical protein